MKMTSWCSLVAAAGLLTTGHAPAAAQTKIRQLAELLAAPRAPSQPVLTVPTGNWVASGEDNRCTASREYGTASAPLLLGLRVKPMSEYVSILVVDGGRKTVETEAAGVDVGRGKPAVASTVEYATIAGGRRIFQLHLNRNDFARAVAQGELWVYSKRSNQRFKVSGMKSLLAVMKSCEIQVIADNGMSKDEQARMAIAPTMLTSVASVFNSDDYPMLAIQNDKHGDVVARLDIDERGAVTDCKIVETSGSAPLDARTCSVAAKRAKFSPALDQQAKPMRSLYFYTIKWRLPG